MMTLGEVRAVMRLTLADETAWPDATLDGWIGEAVRFYAAEFPRTMVQEIALTAGLREVDLPAECLGVVGVEFPAGQEPARYLVQAWPRDLLFRAGGPVYAIRAGRLLLAETPAEGQSLALTYLTTRDLPTVGDDDAPVDVPAAHLEVLVAFVEFRAHWERETGQAATVELVSVALAQLGENARRAWNRYREVIDRLRWLSAGESVVVSWRMADS